MMVEKVDVDANGDCGTMGCELLEIDAEGRGRDADSGAGAAGD